MSDQELADLERQAAANPNDLQLRSKLYVTLVRLGRASQKALELAAYHKDPAAMLVVGDSLPKKELQPYNIRNNEPITGQGFKDLKDLPLQSLDLSECELFDEGMEWLGDLFLQSLNLSGCVFFQKGLKHLKDLPLQTLYLNGCRQITDEGLKHLEGLPLQALYLNGCRQITDEGLKLLDIKELKR